MTKNIKNYFVIKLYIDTDVYKLEQPYKFLIYIYIYITYLLIEKFCS